MPKYQFLIVGDNHIDEDCFLETEHVFKEILKYDAGEVVFLGDVFHKNNPSPKEIDFAMRWFRRFVDRYGDVNVILGNHDLYGGYQVTKLLTYVGVSVKRDNEWSMSSPVGSFFFGHYFVEESVDNYSVNPIKIADISSKYKYVFLGHQHRWQELTNNAWHVGSTRYVGFGEYGDPLIPKKIAVIDSRGDVSFKELKQPYPLTQFSCVDDMYKHYRSGPKTTIYDKIRLKYTDFDSYKKDINKLDPILLPLNHKIKIKLDFVNNQIVKAYETGVTPNQISTEQVVSKWLDSIEDKDVKEILTKESADLCD